MTPALGLGLGLPFSGKRESLPILDRITSGTLRGAFSVRKLREAYTGDSIEVRRSSDNTLLDIGFDADGNLDTAALLTHTGAGDGFVRRWYDQSGSADNLVNSVNSEQPRIVSSGVIDVIGTTPAVNHLTSDRIQNANVSWLQNVGSGYLSIVAEINTSIAAGVLFYVSSGSQTNFGRLGLEIRSDNTFNVFGARLDGEAEARINFGTFTDNVGFQVSTQANYTAATAKVFLNGVEEDDAAFSAAGSTSNTVALAPGTGRTASGARSLIGKISEIILYDGTLTTGDRAILEASQISALL